MTLTKSRLEELRAQATSDLETLKTNLDQERAKGVIELLDEVERLQDENVQQAIEIESRKPPCEQTGYCSVCKSCGEDGCCPVEMCKWPGIKESTMKEIREIGEAACKENVRLTAELERAKAEERRLQGIASVRGDRELELDRQLRDAQAEITRLHEKYDFQELVKREERLDHQVQTERGIRLEQAEELMHATALIDAIDAALGGFTHDDAYTTLSEMIAAYRKG